MLQIMNKLKLKCQPENLTTTTREQSFRNKVLKSTLDYIIHSWEGWGFESINTDGVSDHLIVKWNLNLMIPTKTKTYIFKTLKRTPDNLVIQKLTTSSWPLTIDNDFDKPAYNTKILRPKLLLNKKQIGNWTSPNTWENKCSTASILANHMYIQNLKTINQEKWINIKNYKKLKQLLQLKRKGKIVKQIRTNYKILTKSKSMQNSPTSIAKSSINLKVLFLQKYKAMNITLKLI